MLPSINSVLPPLKILFRKLHPLAQTPTRARDGDAGFDLVATTMTHEHEKLLHVYGTGIAVEIPAGYFGAIFQRGSVKDLGVMLANCVGVIDAGYRGEIIFNFRYGWGGNTAYNVGERIGQLLILPVPQVEFEEVESLSDTQRGQGGFGSTGA